MTDAAVDAVLCASDQDGDGVCDGVDVCPTTFDPGQADLDGDGVGWVCDPVESVTVQAPTTSVGVTAAGTADAFAANIRVGCSNQSTTCTYEVAAASPAGMITARSDSGVPEDAWLAASTQLGLAGPYVTKENRVFISYGGSDETVRVDLAGHTFDLAATATLASTYDQRRPVELIGLTPATGALAGRQIVRPQGNDLVSLGTGYFDGNTFALTTTPVIGVMTYSGSTYGLASYDASTTTFDSFASNLDELKLLYATANDSRLRGEVTYCARVGTETTFYAVRPSGVTTEALPYPSCSIVTFTPVNGPIATMDTLYLTGRDASNNLAVLFWRDGQLRPLFTEPGTGALQVYGDALQVVMLFQPESTTTKLWIVTSTGTVIPVPPTLTHVAVSVDGDTAHIVGVRPGPSVSGTVVLLRYREATGLQEVDVTPAPFTATAMPQLLTTREGAALVGSGDGVAWIAPSTSMTLTPVNLGEFSGGVRGTTTMVFAPQDITHPSSQPAVYAYDELAGPRLTKLTPEVLNSFARLLDPPVGHSEWFSYQNATAGYIARIVYAGTTPTLEKYDVANANDLSIVGQRIGGDLVAVSAGNDIYALGAGGASHVAHLTGGSSTDHMIRDFSASPPSIVGWFGTDAMGSMACLASNPDRCWAFPNTNALDVKVLYASQAENGGEGFFSVVNSTVTGMLVTTSVVRSIGSGDRPQPL